MREELTKQTHKTGDPELEQLSGRVAVLEEEIERIKQRNARVERDKEWEASGVRKLFLVVLTYIITSLVFWLIAIPNPFLNALIPTTAYYLSTLSLPVMKRWWMSRR
jgi:uncharacterized small protein (DUF1192 family)